MLRVGARVCVYVYYNAKLYVGSRQRGGDDVSRLSKTSGYDILPRIANVTGSVFRDHPRDHNNNNFARNRGNGECRQRRSGKQRSSDEDSEELWKDHPRSNSLRVLSLFFLSYFLPFLDSPVAFERNRPGEE